MKRETFPIRQYQRLKEGIYQGIKQIIGHGIRQGVKQATRKKGREIKAIEGVAPFKSYILFNNCVL